MSEKFESCEGCDLLECRGPVPGEFTGEQTDVIFAGEAPGAIEIMQGRPMVGEAGKVLRATIKSCNYTSYGIINVWECRPPGNELPEDGVPAKRCRDLFVHNILSHKPKVIVPLGSVALRAITNQDIGVMQLQGRVFSTKHLGPRFTLLPMYHPSFLRRQGQYWRDWELCHDKLAKLLCEQSDYVPASQRRVTHVHSSEELIKWLVKLSGPDYPVLDCDVETSAGYAPWAGARIISVSISWSKTESIAFPWYNETQVNEYYPEERYITDTPLVRELLQALFVDPNKNWGWYNGQYDTQFFRYEGFTPRIDRDAMLEAHIVDERGSSADEGGSSKSNVFHSLKKDSGFFLDATNWEYEAKVYAPKPTDSYEKIPFVKLQEYNGLDTIHTRHLSDVLTAHMQEEQTYDYYKRVEVPAFNMLARARFFGIRVDIMRVRSLQDEMLPELERLRSEMVDISGNPFFNPNSYKDKLNALHARGLKVDNTQKATLAEYEGDELVDAIRSFSDCAKMYSTYVQGLVHSIYESDKRVHPDWRLPTETGRPRCSDPNLLGMPRKAEVMEHRWKRYIKEQFIADPDKILVHMDRKQSEVRCMVFLADAIEFINHLMTDPRADIHGEFTKMLYGAGYTKEQRVLVKMVVFGLIYNREAPSLALQFTAIEREKAVKAAKSVGKDRHAIVAGNSTGIQEDGHITYKMWSVRDAQKFIDSFFKLFPEVLVYKKYLIREAVKTNKLRGYLGRIRRFGLVNYTNQKSIENQAVNFMPSNLSADLNFVSCAETVKQFGKYGLEVIAPIHDAGLMSIPKDSQSMIPEIQAMWEALPAKVLTWDNLPLANHNPNIPFPVDVTIGERWSDL